MEWTRTYLVVNVVIICIVAAHELEGIPREPVSAMVVHGLECRHQEEKHGLAGARANDPFRKARTTSVQQESFEWMVVERAKRVGHVQTVVGRMELLVQVCVHVHGTVEEVLPGVDDEPAGDHR